MSRNLILIISVIVLTMAAHFATGQGKATAWILLAEGIVGMIMGVYAICRKKRR
ncbi:MAG: hypothetical protein IKD50_01775 [Clostridia bacterium]|nr:hypothetical protein [Clostridia bacterium]